MIHRVAAVVLVALLAACSDGRLPDRPVADIGDGEHVGLVVPPGWTFERLAATEDLLEEPLFDGPVAAFETEAGDGAAVVTVVDLPPDVVERDAAYLGPFVEPAAAVVDGRTVVVSGRGGVDPDAVLPHIGLRDGLPVLEGDAAGLRPVGVVEGGWVDPPGGVRFDVSRSPGASVTAWLVDETEAQVLWWLLVDDTQAFRRTAASMEDITIERPRPVEVGGRRGWVGNVAGRGQLLVVAGDPGIAVSTQGGGLDDDDLRTVAGAVRAVDDAAWERQRAAWLAAAVAHQQALAADHIRMAIVLSQGRELWREDVDGVRHVLYEPGAGTPEAGRLCTGTVVVPRSWESAVVGQSCARPPSPHVSSARSSQTEEAWGLAGPDVARVEVRPLGRAPIEARIVDAAGVRWWVATGPLRWDEVATAVALAADGTVLQEVPAAG